MNETELAEAFVWQVVTYTEWTHPPAVNHRDVRTWLDRYRASPNAAAMDHFAASSTDVTGRIADHVRRWIDLGRPALVVGGWKYDRTLADGIIVDVTYE